MIQSFAKAIKPPLQLLSPCEKLAIDYIKERICVGTIFSLPSELVPVALRGTLDPNADAGVHHNSLDGIVAEALALAARNPEYPQVCIGVEFKRHLFFQVVRTDMNNRFVQFEDPKSKGSFVVVPLKPAAREGDTALFEYRSVGVPALWNFVETLTRSGMTRVWEDMVVWSHSDRARLALTFPHIGMGSLALRHEARHRIWEVAVGHMLDFNAEHPTSNGRFLWEELIPMGEEHLQDMIAAGIILEHPDSAGPNTYSVNMQSVQYDPHASVQHGTRDPLRHVDSNSLQRHCKLACMMHLSMKGWRDYPVLTDWAAGFPLQCNLSISRPKSYFVALALADSILAKFPIAEDIVPCIKHGMTASYYNALLNLQSRDFHKLIALMNGADNVLGISDRAFADIVPNCRDEDAEPLPVEDRLAIADAPASISSQIDIQTLHANAMAVLRGHAARDVDLSHVTHVDYEGHRFTVRFDNYSHSSGKQRCYISCPHKGHNACFKYRQCDGFESDLHATAWLMAWAHHALPQQGNFSKLDHKDWKPCEDMWQEWMHRVHLTGIEEWP